MIEKYYYCTEGKNPVGPFPLNVIQGMSLSPDTKICKEGQKDWQPLADLPIIEPPPASDTGEVKADTNKGMSKGKLIALIVICIVLGPIGWIIGLILLIRAGLKTSSANQFSWQSIKPIHALITLVVIVILFIAMQSFIVPSIKEARAKAQMEEAFRNIHRR